MWKVCILFIFICFPWVVLSSMYVLFRHLQKWISRFLIRIILLNMNLWVLMTALIFKYDLSCNSCILTLHDFQLSIQLIDCHLFYLAIPLCDSRSWSPAWTPLDAYKAAGISGLWWWTRDLSNFTYTAFIQQIKKTCLNLVHLVVSKLCWTIFPPLVFVYCTLASTLFLLWWCCFWTLIRTFV